MRAGIRLRASATGSDFGAGHGLVPSSRSRALCDIQTKMQQHMAGIDPDPHWDWNLTANSRTATCEVPILPVCCVQGSCSPAPMRRSSLIANPEPATHLPESGPQTAHSRTPGIFYLWSWPFDDTTSPFPVPQSGAHRSRTSESARACLTLLRSTSRHSSNKSSPPRLTKTRVRPVSEATAC